MTFWDIFGPFLMLGQFLGTIFGRYFNPIESGLRWPDYSSTLRGTALVIILMRAGLGLDPEALKKHSGTVVIF